MNSYLVFLFLASNPGNSNMKTRIFETEPQKITFQFNEKIQSVIGIFPAAERANLVHDALYKLCRSYLAMIMKQDNNFDGGCNDNMFPYATEQVNNIYVDLVCCKEPMNNFGPSQKLKARCTFDDPNNKINFHYVVFHDLLIKLLMCLDTMEEMVLENKEYGGWKEFFKLLKEFHDVSKLFGDMPKKEGFGNVNAPDMHDNAFDVHRMVIDRPNLLVDSFESITDAQLDFLRAGLYIEFLNEEETGFGMMREWFFLVCREIFNPKHGLFIARAWKILNKNINDVFKVR
ncbi:HECT-like protein [Artemisia annua]|uniref:HECT-type E3 ubiquitin transferase n=1 Tax=Artemisia annua TaxID=35608 RepID=A0A2U1MY99_ARTAN|nr:HECT-like protein [Artemisia annua]